MDPRVREGVTVDPQHPWHREQSWPPALFEPIDIPVVHPGDPSSEVDQYNAAQDEQDRRDHHPFSDLFYFQGAVRAWAVRNFGGTGIEPPIPYRPLIGANEEIGELAEMLSQALAALDVVASIGRLDHAFLKGEQGIRYTPEEAEAKIQDAVGDVLVYLADFCARRRIQMADCVGKAWAEVRRRDWVANSTTGRVDG